MVSFSYSLIIREKCKKSLYSKGSNSGKTIIKKKEVINNWEKQSCTIHICNQENWVSIKLSICAAYMNKHVKFLQWYFLYDNQ